MATGWGPGLARGGPWGDRHPSWDRRPEDVSEPTFEPPRSQGTSQMQTGSETSRGAPIQTSQGVADQGSPDNAA